jgi:hypothetical protein
VNTVETYQPPHGEMVEVTVKQGVSVVYPGQYEVGDIEPYRPFVQKIQIETWQVFVRVLALFLTKS